MEEKIDLIQSETIDLIQDRLKKKYSRLYLDAFSDNEARQAFRMVIEDEFSDLIDTPEKIEYVLRELVGLSFIENLIEDEDRKPTDIGFDGDKLIVEGNGFEKFTVENVSEEDITKLISKFGNTTGKELTVKNPILNTSKNHLRLNAVHSDIAVNGTTMAIRVSRPGLALTEDNFHEFAPPYILDFIKAAVKVRSNILICGETGTGKTELQKLMMSFIPFEERIALIETNKDMYAKENFPDKDIFYWVANRTTTVEDLIAYAGLRSHPIWIMVGEVLGREVYQMIQGILTGHKFISTLHSVSARAIPKRLLGMAKMGYTIDEQMFLDDIYNYVDFGFHIKKKDGVRYLGEIIEFHGDHTATTVFKQVKKKNGFVVTKGSLSEKFFERIEEFGSDFKGLKE